MPKTAKPTHRRTKGKIVQKTRENTRDRERKRQSERWKESKSLW